MFGKLWRTCRTFAVLKQMSNPAFAQLHSRDLIVVSGPETRKLLQGITTNNISLLYDNNEASRKVALYSLFMNPKGRVITDGFIIRPYTFANTVLTFSNDLLVIDVASEMAGTLFQHLKKYTWKKNVELQKKQDRKQLAVYAAYDRQLPLKSLSLNADPARAGQAVEIHADASTQNLSQKLEYDVKMAFFDPRGDKLGLRILCSEKQFINLKRAPQVADESEYSKVCTLHGLTTSSLMKDKLPFMFNSDILNGFSFNKGCYLGQEIIARSYFTGIIRRRVFPYILNNPDQQLPIDQALADKNGQQIGKVLESRPGYGVVLSSYLPLMQKSWPLELPQPYAGQVFNPFQKQLQKYLSDTREKQARLQQIDL